MGNSCIAAPNAFVQSVSNVIFGTKTLPPPNADGSSSSSSNSDSKSPKFGFLSRKLKSSKKKLKDKDSEPDGSPQTTPPAHVRIDQGESPKKHAKNEDNKPRKRDVKQEEIKSAEVYKQEESKSPKAKRQEDNKPKKQEDSKPPKVDVKQRESKPAKADVKQKEIKPYKSEIKQGERKSSKPEVNQGESKPYKPEVKPKAEVKQEGSTKPEVKHGESTPSKSEVKQGESKPSRPQVMQGESMATTSDVKQGESITSKPEVKQEASKPVKSEVKHEESKHVRIEVKQEERKPVTTGPSKSTKKHIRRVSSVGLQVDSVLQRKSGNLKDDYSIGRKLGEGQFGTTHFCLDRKTGKEVACKSIAKRKLITKEDVEDVRREIQIMHHLEGHPNVINIIAAYEDAVAVYMVMELCAGGELFDRIVQRGHYSERKAAELARVIVGVVEACHSLGVMHRDLKPENFLFVNEEEDAPLKAIDFGLSVFFKPGDTFTDVVGSPYYVAPEVLRKFYGQECDVWSAGVIIYILLSGVPPFWDENEHGIFEQVLRGELDFESEPWPSISDDAKDLVKKMLVRDPKKRLTAHEVLRHPWVKVHGSAPDKPLDSAVLSRLKQFSAMHKLKKIAIKIIAERLSEDEIAGLKQMFEMIDSDNSGHITLEELQIGLEKVGANLMESEISDLMEAADLDNSGTIDYTEFVAAMLNQNKTLKEDHLFAAFSYFDKDGSGYITPDELQQVCEQFGLGDVHLEEIMNEVDQDKDGYIDYNEFVAMMQNTEFGKKKIQNSLSIGLRDAFKGGST
ncbi:calcium-dependent protein kinase 26-like [Apium graveolens]|uniref:calcium-dependent protein kinase 26-like n=1 Tax=Apium graveolens TaxID=4045 RepID=UPI003D79BDBC